ncbi:MAG: patatin-like phospholipase family protein [Gemmatimonadaceae bacterium]|nr:patatin-like phospholipase family protein [Gemmatimonadaceae bacterium]
MSRTPRSRPAIGPVAPGPRIGLVLGGGALKGMAHIGALRALEEAGIRPALYAGTSIGAMIAAAAASGMPVAQMTERALRFRRRDLFRINHFGMLMERMLSRSIYLEAPLRTLCDELVADGTFKDLDVPLLVTAVDIDRGVPVVFGRPGLNNVRVRDAIYASCALPGFFPPGVVDGRTCIDGGTTDNLPVAIAAQGVDALIAVDVGIADVPAASGVAAQGFASIFMRAATMMMHEQQQHALERWKSPPLLLVRPKVSHIGWFSFSHIEELLEVGYTATRDALRDLDAMLRSPGGIYPRREVEIVVERALCTGCALCVTRAPDVMALDAEQKAYPLQRRHEWSPADGAFVQCCPVDAIQAVPATDKWRDGVPQPILQLASSVPGVRS